MRGEQITRHADRAEVYHAAVAPQALEMGEERVVFPGGTMLPLSVRGRGVPGLPERPWTRLTAQDFYTNAPMMYSLSLRREPPDVLRGSLRARRTLFEGLMLAMAEKTGRRPSQAEQATDAAMDAAGREIDGRAAMGGGREDFQSGEIGVEDRSSVVCEHVDLDREAR